MHTRMKADPDHAAYLRQWADLYEKNNYDQGLAGFFLNKSHEWSEKPFTAADRFPRVLEVGAGTGVHIGYVRHAFDEYISTDLNPPFLDKMKPAGRNVIVKAEDATRLSFPDRSFDRVIAAHILEHLFPPHQVLREWARVLKPRGLLTLVLPCDPGVGWRLGRYLSARKRFVRDGLDYDYWMAREHVNPINNLVSFVRHYFSDVREEWYPFRVPSMDLNLFYIAHVRV
jgi:SAM-dependent methyltransferase